MLRQAGPHHPFARDSNIDQVWIFGSGLRYLSFCRGFGRCSCRGGSRRRSVQLLQVRNETVETNKGQSVRTPLGRIFCRQRNDDALAVGRVVIRPEVDDVDRKNLVLAHGEARRRGPGQYKQYSTIVAPKYLSFLSEIPRNE